jgi:general secretion pathway protein C
MRNLLTADPDRSSRAVAIGICVLAALLCIWLLVRLLWLFVPRSSAIAAAEDPLAHLAQAKSAATSIAQWHLFGNSQTVDLAARALNAPKTALKLNLRGTLALPDAKDGLAIIADEQNIERSYKVGDAVGSAKLAEVYADHVVLSHDGASESLSMPRAEDRVSLPTAERGASSRPGVAASVPPGYTPPAASAPGVAPANGAAGPLLTRTNAADLARQVQFEPVFDGGKIAGARLSGSGAAAALMNQVGLRPTDIVTAVNGTQLSSVSNPQALLDKFGNASSLQITVQRDGKPATLTLNLR